MIQTKQLLGLGILAGCLLLWFVIIPAQTRNPVAGEFPRFVTVFLSVPALIMVFQPGQKCIRWSLNLEERCALKRSLLLVAVVLLYLIAIPYIGFYTASALGMVAFLLCLGERKVSFFIILPGGLTVLLYLGLKVGLSFQMPSGLLI